MKRINCKLSKELNKNWRDVEEIDEVITTETYINEVQEYKLINLINNNGLILSSSCIVL